MKYFVGLDVSLDETAVCVVNEEVLIVREGKAESEPEALVNWLSEGGVGLQRVGLEAGPLSPRLYEGLRAAGLSAVCIETRRMKGATAAMAVKTDLCADPARLRAVGPNSPPFHEGASAKGRWRTYRKSWSPRERSSPDRYETPQAARSERSGDRARSPRGRAQGQAPRLMPVGPSATYRP